MEWKCFKAGFKGGSAWCVSAFPGGGVLRCSASPLVTCILFQLSLLLLVQLPVQIEKDSCGGTQMIFLEFLDKIRSGPLPNGWVREIAVYQHLDGEGYPGICAVLWVHRSSYKPRKSNGGWICVRGAGVGDLQPRLVVWHVLSPVSPFNTPECTVSTLQKDRTQSQSRF